MKIAVRGGHNWNVIGARAILDEVTENRKIYPFVISNLIQAGHEVLDVTPSTTNTRAEDLRYGVSKAKSFGADVGFSVHLNTGGGNGCEVLYKPGDTKGKELAERICAKLAGLGFKNRGAKPDTRRLYEITHFNTWVIVECFFIDSPEDVELYNKLGPEAIGKAIAEGIVGVEIKEASAPTSASQKPKGNDNVRVLQQLCNELGIKDMDGKRLIEDGLIGKRTKYAVSRLPLCGLQYVQREATRYIQSRVGVKVDGIFGKDTAKAVKKWQSEHGLKSDGIVGANTWLSFLN